MGYSCARASAPGSQSGRSARPRFSTTIGGESRHKTQKNMKYANLLAAAVLAAGVSAQAADQTSATYCVITLPVAAGYNFYGVAVNPETGATYADVMGVNPTTTFISTTDESTTISGATTATQGTAFWYNGAETGWLYQFGIDSEAEDTYTVPAGATTAVVFKRPATLASFTAFAENSNKVFNTAKSNIVSIWDAATQKYVRYYYKTDKGWMVYGGGNSVVEPSSVSIPVGSAVFVHPSTNFGSSNVTITL